MQIAPGMVDPIFLCRLALEMGIPISELEQRMTAHELAVVWPAYFRVVDEARERADRERERESRVRGR